MGIGAAANEGIQAAKDDERILACPVVAAISSASLKSLGFTPLIGFRKQKSQPGVKQYPLDFITSIFILPDPADVHVKPVADESAEKDHNLGRQVPSP